MNILIVTQYFWPEYFPINSIATELASQGDNVTVFTGFPNYPDGEIYQGYSNRLGIYEEVYAGVDIFRIPVTPRKQGVSNLLRNYLSFVIQGIKYFRRLKRPADFDVLFMYAPSPITSSIPAIWYARNSNIKRILWVQDLWPETLRATGHLKNGVLIYLVGLLVRFLYARFDTILVQAQSFVGPVRRMCDKDKRVRYYPNSIPDPMNRVEGSSLEVISVIRRLPGFKIIFTGNLGNAQAVPTILDAAEQLADDDCHIIFFGSGSLHDWAKKRTHDRLLTNVHFAGTVDNRLMGDVYTTADALLLTLASNDVFNYTIPSKLQGYLAAGKPIIGGIGGEAARILEESGAGIVCGAEDSAALVVAIRCCRDLSPLERERMGTSGRRYYFDHYNIENQVKILAKVFKNEA